MPATVEKTSRPRLRRSDLAEPGIRRVKHGRGFRYLLPDGEPVTEQEVLGRIHEAIDTRLVAAGGDGDEATAIQGPVEKAVLDLLDR